MFFDLIIVLKKFEKGIHNDEYLFLRFEIWSLKKVEMKNEVSYKLCECVIEVWKEYVWWWIFIL